jgi:hypothetical protein
MVSRNKIAFWGLQIISITAFVCYSVTAIFAILLLSGFALDKNISQAQSLALVLQCERTIHSNRCIISSIRIIAN